MEAHRPQAPQTTPERNEQAPLGPDPSYDDLLDAAVEYTFPASDPVAVDSCCAQKAARERPPCTDPDPA